MKAKLNIQILLKKINNVFSNKFVLYITSRYFTYGLQFINSILIAIFLGPYFLGVWGFITLVIQYFSQINFGISHSVNALISINKSREEFVGKVIGTSLWMLVGVSLFIGCLFLLNYSTGQNFGGKFDFYKYSIIVYLTIAFGYFNVLFMNVFRVFGRVKEIAFSQSVFPILVLVSLFFFKGADLLWALTGSNLLAFLLSLAFFIKRSPIRLKFLFDYKLVKLIQSKGWSLFLFNTSFFLIVISTRFFISGYYSVKEFGFFTFAFSLANAILLLLQSVSFLIFPKLLNRFASATNDTISSVLNTIRDAYITVSHSLIHLAILVFPYFLLFFPQYKETAIAFHYIALTIVLYTNTFGYQGLLIAKGNEKLLGFISFCAFIFNLLITYTLIQLFKVEYYQVIMGTLVTYIFYVFSLGYFGRKRLNLAFGVWPVLKDVFPLRIFVPYMVSLILLNLTTIGIIYNLIPFMLFIFLNISSMDSVRRILNNILKNPEIVDI